jgi:fatty acyl-ACP thioesterase B
VQSVPQSLSVAHELTSMVLEYKRECSPSDIVQSLTSPDVDVVSDDPLLGNGALDGSPGAVSCSSGALKLNPEEVEVYAGPLKYTHLLRLQTDGSEIVRGRTEWRLKQRYGKQQ